MSIWSALIGTTQPSFRFGLAGAALRTTGTALEARLPDNSDRAQVIARGLAVGADSQPFATTGDISLQNLSTMIFRNAANTADVEAMRCNVTNDLGFGNDVNGRNVDLRGTASVRFFVGGTLAGTFFNDGLEVDGHRLSFSRLAANPFIIQSDLTAAGTPSPLLILAQGSNQANTPGAVTRIGGGTASGGGTGTNGGVRVGLGAGTDVIPLLETIQTAVSPIQRAVGLGFTTGLTPTIIPAGAGDLVTVIANAGTIPSVDIVGGFSFYGDLGRPCFRFLGNNLRIDGTTTVLGTPSITALGITINGTAYKIPLNT